MLQGASLARGTHTIGIPMAHLASGSYTLVCTGDNQFWQQSNKPIMLDTPKKFNDCSNYVRQNPVVAGLVTDETAYKWSSANPHIGIELDEAPRSLTPDDRRPFHCGASDSR